MTGQDEVSFLCQVDGCYEEVKVSNPRPGQQFKEFTNNPIVEKPSIFSPFDNERDPKFWSIQRATCKKGHSFDVYFRYG